MDANDMGDALERILISEQQIADKLQEMATQIDRDYRGREILLVGVLKGATMVMADLSRLIHTPLRNRLDGGLLLWSFHQILRGGPDS